MKNKNIKITNVKGNTGKFKKDLLKELGKKTYKDHHEVQECLEIIAKRIISDYIYFETDVVEDTSNIQIAEEILERHKDAFKELAK